ncbi:hypothetical protein [Tissierella pigra]|uniref:Phage tail protein n=1 Tax=Tissierella pigra TaxID=2607614 RepID=A0A6N7XMC5_9FIRM|nr:hypothetical protein [Tissierella pigra]MSU01932.1 hypothetical protein [Tissierella pigra]
MQPIYFSKAGKFMLNKYVDGRPVRSALTSYFRNGVVQSITPNITINGTPIGDGNSLWNAAQPDTSIEGTVAIQLGFMPPELYAYFMGDEIEEVASAPFPIIDEEILVPDEAPFEVTLANTPLADSLILVDIHGKPWEKAEADVTTGKYKLTGGKLEFNEEDAGKALFVTYDFQATNVTKFGLPKTPKRESYQVIISGEATGEDETLYNTALILDKAKVMGSINPPAQGGEPQPITITFTILKPRGNNRAVDYMATPLK